MNKAFHFLDTKLNAKQMKKKFTVKQENYENVSLTILSLLMSKSSNFNEAWITTKLIRHQLL